MILLVNFLNWRRYFDVKPRNVHQKSSMPNMQILLCFYYTQQLFAVASKFYIIRNLKAKQSKINHKSNTHSQKSRQRNESLKVGILKWLEILPPKSILRLQVNIFESFF